MIYSKIQKVIVVILVISSLTSTFFFRAQEVEAVLLDDFAAGAAKCLVMDGLTGLMDNWLGDLGGDFFDLGIDVGLGSDSVPVTVETDIPREKDNQKHCYSQELKRALIIALANDIRDFVRDTDKFIENFKEEFKRTVDVTAASFVEEVIGVDICTPFRPQFEIILHNSLPRWYRSSPFACSLTDAINIQSQAIERFFDDFRSGSWDRWIRFHESSNNELGFWLETRDEQILRQGEALQAEETQVVAYQGYRPQQKCISGGDISTCPPEDLITITPGINISDQVNRAVGAEVDHLVQNADTFYEVVGAIISIWVSDVLINGI